MGLPIPTCEGGTTMKIHNRKPDIENLYKVLRRQKPDRPTLYELFLNEPLYEELAGRKADHSTPEANGRFLIDAFQAAGYDYTTIAASDFHFPAGPQAHKSTKSLNEGFVITDEASFAAYPWPDPEAFDYSRLAALGPCLPEGMKFMIIGPMGVLENAIQLVGYENLCYILYENPDLFRRIFDAIGTRLLKYYEIAATFDSVGVILSNDDWGFKTQTFYALETMRAYVLPWHKKIVDCAHHAGKMTVLHSCGFFGDIMEDVIQLGFDGKHSYEDTILPVEDSYDRWKGRIGILGGMDVDFLIRSDTAAIRARCQAMLDRAATAGGYALGTGNSVPAYLPTEKYLAMVQTALQG
jgi:uroporphyrinogen decarboxylase